MPQSATVPIKVTIELDETQIPAPAPIIGVQMREVPGGVVLDVAPEAKTLLVEFGWLPPEDGE